MRHHHKRSPEAKARSMSRRSHRRAKSAAWFLFVAFGMED